MPPVTDPSVAPQPKRPSAVADRTKGGTERSGALPAWASKSLKLIARIRRCGYAGSVDGEADPVWTIRSFDQDQLELPLEVDTQKLLKVCGELLGEARTLDNQAIPFPARLRSALSLIDRTLGMMMGAEGALYYTHLVNLISVIRLYAEVHQTPDAAVARKIEFICDLKGQGDGTRDGASAEVDQLLQVAAVALEIELQLACDPPSVQEIKKAESIGYLAYGDTWRARLRTADALDRRIFSFSYSKKVNPKYLAKYLEDSNSVVAEFTRIWCYAWWICRAADFLSFPSKLRYTGEKPSGYYGLLPFVREEARWFLEARGSWRFIEVCDLSRFNDEFENHSLDASLLKTSLNGLGRIAAHQDSWHTPPIAANPRKLLDCLALANSRFQLNSPVDSAALVHAALRDVAEPTEPRSDYITASARCLRHCISRHPAGRRYWHPAESIQTDSVRSVLWSHMIHLLATDDTSAGDAVFVAHMTDPEHGAFRAGIDLYSPPALGRYNRCASCEGP